MKLRLGIIGLGPGWQKRYRPALRALSDRFEVRAFCEAVAHRARQVALEFEADWEQGFRSLVQREDVDALLVLSAQWYGMLPVLAACEAGKAVFCTNELALTLPQAQQLRRQVLQSGVAFMAEFPQRYAPATTRLKELIVTRLGQPRLLFCHVRAPQEDAASGLGEPFGAHAPFAALVELVDLCRFVVGREPGSVLGVVHGAPGPHFEGDYQLIHLEFPHPERPELSAMANISYGRYIPSHWPEAVSFRPPAALQVQCEHGVAFIDWPDKVVWFDSAGRHMENLESERPLGELMLLQFYRHVTSLVRRTDSLEDAYRALLVVRQAEQSVREGRRIPLNWEDASNAGAEPLSA